MKLEFKHLQNHDFVKFLTGKYSSFCHDRESQESCTVANSRGVILT